MGTSPGRTTLVALALAVTAVLLVCSGASAVPIADYVMVRAADSALVVDGAAASVAGSQVNSGLVVGTARAAASLGDGLLRAGALGIPRPEAALAGQSAAFVGLRALIHISGPEGISGIVAVTMTVSGVLDRGTTPSAGVFLLAQTGQDSSPGIGGRGFTDPAANQGLFRFTTTVLSPDPVVECQRCAFAADSGFPFSVTALLPFGPEHRVVYYKAQLDLEVLGDASVDAFDTAVFSIAAPAGFSVSSALTFQEPAAPVSLPPSLLLSAVACGGVWAWQRSWIRRTWRRPAPTS
jgi:hypothetical protein